MTQVALSIPTVSEYSKTQRCNLPKVATRLLICGMGWDGDAGPCGPRTRSLNHCLTLSVLGNLIFESHGPGPLEPLWRAVHSTGSFLPPALNSLGPSCQPQTLCSSFNPLNGLRYGISHNDDLVFLFRMSHFPLT